jgi:ABC-type branched-subunit amino acid transport system ATPase component
LADETDFILTMDGVDAGYDKKQVLFDVEFKAPRNAIVAVIGPNGSGKSTLLKVLSGLLPVWRGAVCFSGRRVDRWSPKEAKARGIAYLPQGNRVFDELTVEENLEIGGLQLSRSDLKGRIDKVLQFFPALSGRLKERAGKLSGGERQMVALGGAMIKSPAILLLDEPSMGLSPRLSHEVLDNIWHINRDTGAALVVVEQKVFEIVNICNFVYVLRLGRIVFAGPPVALMTDPPRLKELFL